MAIQETYPITAGANALYDFVDIANGSGVQVYYGCKTAQATYILTGQTVYSNYVATTVIQTPAVENVFEKFNDKDFDVLINRPMAIQGAALIEVPFVWGEVATSYGSQGYTIVNLSYVRGGVETSIVAGTGGYPASAQTPSLHSLTIPLTVLKRGDTLRLTVEGWVMSQHGPTVSCFGQIGHDPMNRLEAGTYDFTVSSVLKLRLPVRIEVET